MKMEPIVSSETSAIRTQTPGNYPKRNNLQSGFSYTQCEFQQASFIPLYDGWYKQFSCLSLALRRFSAAVRVLGIEIYQSTLPIMAVSRKKVEATYCKVHLIQCIFLSWCIYRLPSRRSSNIPCTVGGYGLCVQQWRYSSSYRSCLPAIFSEPHLQLTAVYQTL